MFKKKGFKKFLILFIILLLLSQYLPYIVVKAQQENPQDEKIKKYLLNNERIVSKQELRYGLSVGEDVVTLQARYPTGQYKVEKWAEVVTYPEAPPSGSCAHCYFEVIELKTGTYMITFLTEPPDVGSIIFSGIAYTSGQSGEYAAGTYQIEANVPKGYIFYNWATTGGISVANSESRQTTASVTGSGSLVAVFKWFVKLRGTVISHVQHPGGWPAIDVKIEELLLDTSNRLKLSEVVEVYRETSFTEISDGDYVEVYGLGFWISDNKHGVVIKWSEHYIRKITKSDKFRVLVVFTRFQDEPRNYFEERLSISLPDFLQKLDYVSNYFYEQSYYMDVIVFKIDFPEIVMPRPAREYRDSIRSDNSYTPNADYLNDVWDSLTTKKYNGILTVQTDWALRAHGFETFRAATCNPTLLPPGVEEFFGIYKGDIPAAMITFDEDTEVIAHELGHVLYGFKDYYTEERVESLVVSDGNVKQWCLMGGPIDEVGPQIDQQICSLNKVKAGWLKWKEIELKDIALARTHKFEIKSLESMNFGDEVLQIYKSEFALPTPYTIYYILEGRETFPLDYVEPGWIKERFGIDEGVVIYRRGRAPLIPPLAKWIKIDPALEEEDWSWTLPTLSEKTPIYFDPLTKVIFAYKGYDKESKKFIIEVSISETPERAARAIEKGLSWLRSQQNVDGSWTYHGPRFTGPSVGLTSLIALSFLNQGYKPDKDPTLRKAIEYIISKVRTDGSIYDHYQIYDTAIALSTLLATNKDKYRTYIENALNFLITSQNVEPAFNPSHEYYGGWPYFKGQDWADLSNTQFVLLALYEAKRAGFPVPDETFRKAEIFLNRCQNLKSINPDFSFYDDGGFIYKPKGTNWANGKSYASMTAAGIWSLYCCGVSIEDIRMKSAFNWLSVNYDIEQNYPIGNTWLYYYLYTLAKACSLTGIEIIGEHDWYEELVNYLVLHQNFDGSWPSLFNEEPIELATVEAILALETKSIVSGTTIRFKVDSPVDLHIYDPLGRHIGIDYITGNIEIEIPNATYSGPGTKPQIISISNPMGGKYSVKLVGRMRGSYNLTIEGFVGVTAVYSESYSGSINPGELHVSEVMASAIVGPLTIYVKKPGPIKTMIQSSTGTGNVSFISDKGTIENLTAIRESDLPKQGVPSVSFPHGLFSFKITNLIPRQTVNVEIVFPKDIPINAQYWGYQKTGSWYQIPIVSNNGDNIIIVQLTDGGVGDDDGVANGLIVHTGGVSVPLLLGDINGDGIVDYKDLAILAIAYGSKKGDPNFNPLADLNNDSIIDYKDLAILASNYGKKA